MTNIVRLYNIIKRCINGKNFLNVEKWIDGCADGLGCFEYFNLNKCFDLIVVIFFVREITRKLKYFEKILLKLQLNTQIGLKFIDARGIFSVFLRK